MTKTVLIFFSILMLSSSQLLGQVVKRNETTGAFKFTHEISSYGSYFSGIQSPKISVMWNSLMGEPIEDYKFYWEYAKFWQAIHYNGLPLEDYLENHSDLLKRFKGVIPKFDIFFQIKLENCEGVYCEETFERTISSNMMIVANAGKKINISVPSSPKDWYVFFGIDKDWAGSKTRVDKLYEAFRKAKNIYILSVRLYNLEWGDQIESIIRELERRREREKKKKAEEKDEEDDDFWNGEEEKDKKNKGKQAGKDDSDYWKGEKTTTQKEDFWSGDEDEKVEDDFWSGQGTSEEEVDVQKNIAIATGNLFIGEETVETRNVTIYYYDHGEIDGDRVNIYHNGKIIVSNITLKSYEKSVKVVLNDGVNRISFEALNNGTAGENSASFTIKDDNNKQLYSNEWIISAGYKGTLLLIKK